MHADRIVRARALLGVGLVAIGAALWVGGCGDGSGGVGPGLDISESEPIVSDPVLAAATASRGVNGGGATFASLGAIAAASDLAYVSLPPGVVPNGERVTIRKRGSATTLTTVMIDGGFDPVPVAAAPGDIIDVDAQVAGSTPVSFSLKVPSSRPPRVVRTYPPPKKRDVALNQRLVIIFSEPIDGRTLTPSSVQLFRGSTRISGTARPLDGVTAAIAFEPTEALAPNTDYRLVVTERVEDLEGDPLAANVDAEFTTGTEFAKSVEGVYVVPDATALAIGEQVQLTAIAADSTGASLAGRPVAWSTDSARTVVVSATGLVTGIAAGFAAVHAVVDQQGGTAFVLVSPSLPPVESLQLTPEAATVPLGQLGGTIELKAVTKDADGNALLYRQVRWSSSNASVATVTGGSRGEALVTGVGPGTATITATSEGKSQTAAITVVRPGRYMTLSAGGPDFYNGGHTCGLTVDDWVQCWGSNQFGQAGTGTAGSVLAPMGIGVASFNRVSASYLRGCALTADGAAYCWGAGVLGIGEEFGPDVCFGFRGCSQTPLPVAGGHRFKEIAVAGDHICALTAGGEAYCWGYNSVEYLGDRGQGLLGTGSATGPEFCYNANVPCAKTPVAVAGGLVFTTIATGGLLSNGAHACALTESGAAYCWGENTYGQLGDGTQVDRSSPVPVAGGLTFAALSVGWAHSCALTVDGAAYCWGSNNEGGLGVGSSTGPEACPAFGNSWPCSKAPVPVATSLRWTSISTHHQSCAITPSGAAYCWGPNWTGQLGTGTTTAALTPEPVAGGLTFASVSAGSLHSCGVTTDGIAYCWGDNSRGELGDGSITSSTVPVRVAGQP